MNDRDFLIAGLDLLLALLVIFIIGFFAVRYDESRGPDPEILSLEALEASMDGDYDSLLFLGIYLTDDYIQLREYRYGQWLERGAQIHWDWREYIDYELSRNRLPIVIYEMEDSPKFGELVRQISSYGQPIGIAKNTDSEVRAQ